MHYSQYLHNSRTDGTLEEIMTNAADDDDDYFSSLPSTSLANVFMKNKISDDDRAEDKSLNYTPVKPKQDGETKCVFTCFFTAFEWSNSSYVSKGKVGLAVIRAEETDIYNILIYDASKLPLCYINVRPTFQVKVKNVEYILFYDDVQRYWMLHSNCNDVENTLTMFKSLGIDVVHQCEDVIESEQQEIKNEVPTIDISPKHADNKESDTDSSANQHKKAAILRRMANMGHAILPASKCRAVTNDSSSDDGKQDIKSVHKSTKIKLNTKTHTTLVKDNSENNHMETIKGDPSYSKIINTPHNSILNNSQSDNFYAFLTEHRTANSELRINLGRISDKVDAVIKNLTDTGQNSNMQFLVEVYRKLLNEYESKIKTLEESQLRDSKDKHHLGSSSNANNDIVSNLEAEIMNLRRTAQEKETQILNLQSEVNKLSTDINKEQNNELLSSQMDELKQMIQNINVAFQPHLTHTQFFTHEQVKEIMNEVFQSVCLELEDNSNYTSEELKKLVGASIKKTTFTYLNIK